MDTAGATNSRRPLAPAPPWLPLLEPDAEGAGGIGPDREAGVPGEGWPPLATIDYMSKLIVLVLLILALPWLIDKLLTDPTRISGHAAKMAMGA